MAKLRIALVLSVVACLFAGPIWQFSKAGSRSQEAQSRQTLWTLEDEYWLYVQDNNLSAYSSLWHKNFLGWPSVSPAPVRKDHITDWITSQTSKGLAFKSGELKPAAIQMNGDTAVVCYWMTYKWLDKEGRGVPHTIRVTHTWLKEGKAWQIIGGMSMQEAAHPPN